MARKFYEITLSNIGVSGEDRPAAWPPLSKNYIRYLKRKSFGTPLIPTELRKGTLRSSITIQTNHNSTTVYSNNPYIAAQQYGDAKRNLPARPFFPVMGEHGLYAELTPNAEAKILAAAIMEMGKILDAP